MRPVPPAARRRAFTLIELIVTITILGILAALAVPAFSAVQDRAKDAADQASVEAIGREAAALAAFDQTAVGAAHLQAAIDDTATATALLVAAGDGARYSRNGAAGDSDTTALGKGEWDFVGYAGTTAYAAFIPDRIADASRVLYLQVGTAAAEARWSDVAASDTAGDPAHAAGTFDGAAVEADDGSNPPSSSGTSADSGGSGDPAGTGGDVLLADTFTRADGPLVGSVTETGGAAWTTVRSNDTAVVVAGAVETSGNGYHYSAADAGAADVSIAVEITGPGGIIGRAAGANSFWLAYVSGSNWTVQIEEAGVQTVAGSGTFTAPPSGTPAHLELAFVGNQATFTIDGTVVSTVTSSQMQSATSHGMFVSSTSIADNFTVTSP